MKILPLILLLVVTSPTYAEEAAKVADEIQIGFSVSSPWEVLTGGYTGTYRVAEAAGPDSPKKTATWRVTLPHAGRAYRVQVIWTADPRNARHAGYSLYDGNRPLKLVNVDQTRPPKGEKVGEFEFQDLGVFTVKGKSLQIDLSNDSDGRVVADTVRVGMP